MHDNRYHDRYRKIERYSNDFFRKLNLQEMLRQQLSNIYVVTDTDDEIIGCFIDGIKAQEACLNKEYKIKLHNNHAGDHNGAGAEL